MLLLLFKRDREGDKTTEIYIFPPFLISSNGNSHQPAHSVGELSTVESPSGAELKPSSYDKSALESFVGKRVPADAVLKLAGTVSYSGSDSWLRHA